jgi:NTE family protein
MILPDFLKQIKSAIDHEYKRTLYQNLVFSGGGVRGIAYLGALEVLDEFRILENIQRVAGTSAGAIAACLVSFGLDITKTRDLFNSLNITKLPQVETQSDKRRWLPIPEEESPRRFFRDYGWYSSEYFYNWLQNIISDQCGGNSRATFADFKQHGFRDLFIVATNVSRQRAEVFSADQTPEVSVADAVRMSMSIPIFFEALRFDGQKFGSGEYYVDGGLYDNFPVRIFDKPEYAGRSWTFRDGINWETLGLFLYPGRLGPDDEPEIPENVWDFMSLMLRSLYHSYEVASYETNTVDQERTIEINDCGIPPTDFDIEVGDKKYQQLYQSGKEAAGDFFQVDT